jgi:hypothetical protein
MEARPIMCDGCLWREQNARSFEGNESGRIKLRKLALHTLLNWSRIWSNLHESNFFDFLELSNSFSNQ